MQASVTAQPGSSGGPSALGVQATAAGRCPGPGRQRARHARLAVAQHVEQERLAGAASRSSDPVYLDLHCRRLLPPP